jgi:two-component system, OmpR family, sensor histidine kinase KdpD
MEREQRPNPDALLRRLKDEDESAKPSRGRLKIFLGAAAGVGKTYHMLEDALQLKSHGIDVVVALVETHGRPETEALLDGLDILPRRKVELGGIIIDEMDLDAVLARRPALALVDELAHTNAPESRHQKRVQDVDELLEAGICVYTTLNIQHVESLNDVVYQITGVRVRETVPDSVLETADEVEVVDLPPEELLQRFREGKVYVPLKAEQAMQRFFRKGNLLGLRELALRYTARKVDKEMRSYMETHDIIGPWPAGSRLLVCISASQLSGNLIRIGQRMAADQDAEWFVAHVESPEEAELSLQAREQLAQNLLLAEELGAKLEILTGHDVADEILNFARTHNITLIIVGLPRKGRLRRRPGGSVVSQLTTKSGPIHVLVIGSTGTEEKETVQRRARGLDPRSISVSLVSVAVTAAVCWVLQPWLGFVNTAMIMLLPVVFSGTVWGRLAGITASVMAVAALDLFFVQPYFSFTVADLIYLPAFFVFFIVAIVTSLLSELVRWQGESARKRERIVSALYEFSRSLMAARSLDEVLNSASKGIAEAFDCGLLILLPDKSGKLEIRAQTGDGLDIDERKLSVATWVFDHGQEAGKGTETLSSAGLFYMPLVAHSGVVGVLGVDLKSPDGKLLPERKRLLESFANILALALSRDILPSFTPYDKRSFGRWWIK